MPNLLEVYCILIDAHINFFSCMCFCRLCNWDFVEITKEDVESLDLNSYPASYLSHVIRIHFQHPVFTTNFTKLKNSLKSIQRPHQYCSICLRGPKGCGKTFTLAATFALHHNRSNNAYSLLQHHFDNSTFSNMYLHKFVEGLGDDELPTSVRDKALKSLELGKPSEALQTVLMEMNDSLVFADLSSLHNTEHAVDLLDIECMFIFYHTDIRSIK